MRKKATECLGCVHHSLSGEYDEILTCAKGHKPRFYQPKDPYPHWADWGWKRCCSEYQEIKSYEISQVFRISADPFITDAYCECGADLKEVSNGWFSRAMFCPKCHNVYELKLIKFAKNKINADFIKEAIEEIKSNEKNA